MASRKSCPALKNPFVKLNLLSPQALRDGLHKLLVGA